MMDVAVLSALFFNLIYSLKVSRRTLKIKNVRLEISIYLMNHNYKKKAGIKSQLLSLFFFSLFVFCSTLLLYHIGQEFYLTKY